MKKTRNILAISLLAALFLFTWGCKHKAPITSVTVYAEMGNPMGGMTTTDCGSANTKVGPDGQHKIRNGGTNSNAPDSTGGGPSCDGMGLCAVSADANVWPNEIKVTFSIDPNNVINGVQQISISFDWQALNASKAAEAQALQTSTSYTFNVGFVFSCDLFRALNIPPDANIAANATGTVSINSDGVVTINMPLTIPPSGNNPGTLPKTQQR